MSAPTEIPYYENQHKTKTYIPLWQFGVNYGLIVLLFYHWLIMATIIHKLTLDNYNMNFDFESLPR